MRKDARLMTETKNYQTFYTYLMPKRTGATCWSLLQADATGIIKLIDKKKKEGRDITVFQIVIAALIRTAAMYPELNRFIYGHKYYARKDYTFSFAINIGEQTIFRKVYLDPMDNLSTVSEKLRILINDAKTKPDNNLEDSVNFLLKLPSFITSFILSRVYPWMIDKGILPEKFTEGDLLYCSAMVSNLGTFSMNAPMHHLYEWGNASVFVTIGVIKKTPVALPDGTIIAQDMIDFGFTVDDRVCDGKKMSDALSFFQECIENPEVLEQPPDKVVREY
jgi:pyruvate/2-oxoglutarate dehydrogenase complex dihydrolipoamide acyltransferase (E2) component